MRYNSEWGVKVRNVSSTRMNTLIIIKVRTTTSPFTFYRVEHYLLCYSFALKIVAHAAFAAQSPRRFMIQFINKKIKHSLCVCAFEWNESAQSGKRQNDKMNHRQCLRKREKLLLTMTTTKKLIQNFSVNAARSFSHANIHTHTHLKINERHHEQSNFLFKHFKFFE